MTKQELLAAKRIVEGSDLVDVIDDLITPRRVDGTVEVRGRNRVLSVRTLLLAFAVNAVDGRAMHVTRITATINGWSGRDSAVLKIPLDESRLLADVTHKQVSDLWNTIARLFESSPHFSEADLWDAEDADEQLADREANLQRFTDMILDGSVSSLDPSHHTGHYVVDWTYNPSWARHRRAGTPTTDPDGGWINIDGHGYAPKWWLFGYRIHGLVRTRTPNGDRVPYVCERFDITAAAEPAPDPTVAMIRRFNDPDGTGAVSVNRPVIELVADRGYSVASAGEWADPLRKLGIELVYDLKGDQIGQKGDANGAIEASGCFYCPMTPKPLLEIGAIPCVAPTADRIAHFNDVERRDQFACEPHTAANRLTGDQRFVCPAVDDKLRCPLVPASMANPLTIRTVKPSKEIVKTPPPICSQQTVVMPGSSQANLRQKYRYGSEEWFDAYSRRTPNVESFFGNLRDESAQHMARGRIRVMGRAKNSWMLAWWIAAVNMRLIAAFERETQRQLSDPGRVLDRRKPRRNRAIPFVDLRKIEKRLNKGKRRQSATASGSPP